MQCRSDGTLFDTDNGTARRCSVHTKARAQMRYAHFHWTDRFRLLRVRVVHHRGVVVSAALTEASSDDEHNYHKRQCHQHHNPEQGWAWRKATCDRTFACNSRQTTGSAVLQHGESQTLACSKTQKKLVGPTGQGRPALREETRVRVCVRARER